MFRLTAATRISLGLVCSMLGILMAANYFQLIPDEQTIVTNNRVQLVESLAITSAPIIEAGELPKLQAVLEALVTRYDQLLSVGLRNTENELLTTAGPHVITWPADLGEKSTERFMQVALSSEQEAQWARLEVAFTPTRADGVLGQLQTRMTTLLLFCAPIAFFSFRWFLTMVLKNLDPSQAIPRRVREALDILSEGLMIIGLNDRVLLANQATEIMTGVGYDRLIGLKASQLPLRRVESQTDNQMPWRTSLLEDRSVLNVMMELTDDEGPSRIFRVNCSPLVGNDGANRGVMVTFDDVTLIEINKIELRSAKEDAEAANMAKSTFLANMSHEIRNPMNAIVGFTDILRRGMEDCEDTRRDYLNTIHASGTHLVSLINDVLDLAKIESGKLELDICDCRPYQLMNEVVNVLQMKAQEQNLTLELLVRGTIPTTIRSDATRVRQILMNLVGNAIKFTEAGGVQILAETCETNGRSQIRFSVADTGIGMTPEQCEKIFEEFVQAESSVTRRFGGTGLGLAISKRLTEALGGAIVVSSSPGEGTTFAFTVDTGDIAGVELVDNAQASLSLTRRQRQQQQSGLTIKFKPARVLITDDTPANRQLVGLVLRQSGLAVEEAEDGLQAVRKAHAEDFDVLLMDMQMPVMDGFTATRKLREQGVTVPIFALTANIMQSDRERCEAAGCTGFLTKPINMDALLSKLAEVLPVDNEAKPEATPPRTVEDRDQKRKQQPKPRTQVEDPQAVPDRAPQMANKLDEVMAQVDSALSNAAHPSATPPRPALRSTLPVEIPEFFEIVVQFAAGLPQMLTDMRRAWETREFVRLGELAHKLKGTGGTVGFPDFTAPAHRLQQLAMDESEDGIEHLLWELQELASVIDLPDCADRLAGQSL